MRRVVAQVRQRRAPRAWCGRRWPWRTLVLAACLLTCAPLSLPSSAMGAAPSAMMPDAAAHLPAADSPQPLPTSREVAWADRGSLTLPARDALEALSYLPDDAPAPEPWTEGGGREGWFGQAWEDVDGNGCDTRNEILARDLSEADFSRKPGVQGVAEGRGAGVSSCPDATVYAGTLHDPYTGKVVDFKRGENSSAAVQIDHVVPLNYLYAHGAWKWSQRERLLVANDPLNLLAVAGSANQAKSNCGPATCPQAQGGWDPAADGGWWPPAAAERCAYAARFTTVLAEYGLGVPSADRKVLERTLANCAEGGSGQPALLARLDTASTAEVVALGAALVAVLAGAGLMLRARAKKRMLRAALRARRW